MNPVLGTVLPVFGIVGLGYALAGRPRVDPKSLAELAILVAAPCFIFSSLAGMDLQAADWLWLVVGPVCTVGVMFLVTRWWMRGRRGAQGFVLCATLWNAGNLPIPCADLAWGEAGKQAATLVFVTVASLHATLGVAIAKGRGGVGAVLRLPLVHASWLGILVAVTDTEVPPVFGRPVELLGQMAIPLMLLTLGMALRTLRVTHWRQSLAVAVVRIAGGFLVMWVLVSVAGVEGVTRQVLLLNAGMPPAVINHVIASRYGADPDLVAGSIVIATLLAMVTIPLTLAVVG